MVGTLAGRSLGSLRLLWAISLLCWPELVISALGGEVTSQSRRVGRVLGARHLVQGIAEVSFWPRGRRAGSLVDAAHALSIGLVALVVPQWRKIAARDAVVAALFAIAGISRRV